eukprot:Gregarina_sp_Poly_1__8662@NODE_515_length_7812_cov_238_903163_g409_i0_p3_GENE_NODE_515_length_7812_cov_238_903163_g409_i0NODE_515_length_7812_cov_238_903163_g409_i0_p3_ORF_typecomplete_len378_score17_78_NODE_515_length_7812_cov_238_903163_g409_i062197352
MCTLTCDSKDFPTSGFEIPSNFSRPLRLGVFFDNLMSSPSTIPHTPLKSRKSKVPVAGFFGRLRRRQAEPSSPKSPVVGCCFFRSRRPANKAVRFSNKDGQETSDHSTVPSSHTRTPRVVKARNLSSRGLHVNDNKGGLLTRSSSRKTFYTAISRHSPVRSTPDSHRDRSASNVSTSPLQCVCTFVQHTSYCADIPIITGPGIEAGSYEELVVHAKSILGTWVTILERSQSLDEHMTYVGIGKMKRMIMNKLSIPFTAVLEKNDTLLHAWITTPVGQKHTHASLIGEETFDQDSDLGDWTALTSIVDYSIDWFCEGKSVRAMQMERKNPTLGLCYETRVVLPDAIEGKVLLYNFTLHPPPTSGKPVLKVDRLFKANS